MATATSGPPIAGSSKPPASTKKAATPSPTPARIKSGRTRKNHRVMVYGGPGLGKSSLAGLLSSAGLSSVVIDVDHSADILGLENYIDDGLDTYQGVLDILRSKDLEDFDAVVIDSVSRVEDLATRHVIEHIATDGRGGRAKSIEDYGFGKGYTHVYEAFLLFVAECDRLFAAGKTVVLIAHDVTAMVPNPQGEDFQRYEPRLLSPKSGRGSIRLLLKEWVDHLFFICHDLMAEDGKATGGGTRTIYCEEMPHFWAKSRSLKGNRPYPEGDASLWLDLFNVNDNGGK